MKRYNGIREWVEETDTKTKKLSTVEEVHKLQHVMVTRLKRGEIEVL